MIDLRAVGIIGKLEFERTGVEILIRSCIIEPIFADSTVKVEVEVLHTEVVHAVVKLAMELLLTKVGKACNGISNIARCNSRL